jgi:hypothetical protein
VSRVSSIEEFQSFVNYSFLAYGVGIRSATFIPGLQPTSQDAANFSLQFEMGAEPSWVKIASALPGRVLSYLPEEPATADPAFVLTEYGQGKCYELAYSDGARFVFDGALERLWGSIQPSLTLEDFYMYWVGPVMGFLLRHRNTTCLHASAVELHDRAVLFSGDPGYGKSTTAAALALRGAPVLGEDIVPLKLTEGRYWAVPGYPRVCLWPDAVAKLFGDGDALPRLTPTWNKRYLQLDGVRAKFAAESKPLGIIYLFGGRSDESRAPFIEAIPSREAVLGLVQNTYMNWLIDRERRAAEFDELCKIVLQVPVRRVVAHSDGARLGDLCDRIFDDAKSILGNG